MGVGNLCTVIIPTKSKDDLLERCLKTLFKYYKDTPVIIVSDHEFVIPYTNMTVIKSSSLNISDKRNQAARVATTKYIAFIDSDAYPASNWLEAGISFLESQPNVGLVGGPNLEFITNKNQFIQSCAFLASKSPLLNREKIDLLKPTKVSTISSSNMMTRKDLYIKLGGMNKKVFTGEDIELSYRYLKDYNNYFLPNMKVYHKQRSPLGFIKQRFIWGRGVFTVLKYVFPHYLISLMPLFFICTLLTLAITDLLLSTTFSVYLFIFYLLIVLFESVRLCMSLAQFGYIFFYCFCSLPVLGIGTLYSIIAGDINNNYKDYNNSE